MAVCSYPHQRGGVQQRPFLWLHDDLVDAPLADRVFSSFPCCGRKYPVCHEAAEITADYVLKIPFCFSCKHR